MQIGPLGLDCLAIQLTTSRDRWLRGLWWVPQAAAAAVGFVRVGVHKLGLPGPIGIPADGWKMRIQRGPILDVCSGALLLRAIKTKDLLSHQLIFEQSHWNRIP